MDTLLFKSVQIFSTSRGQTPTQTLLYLIPNFHLTVWDLLPASHLSQSQVSLHISFRFNVWSYSRISVCLLVPSYHFPAQETGDLPGTWSCPWLRRRSSGCPPPTPSAPWWSVTAHCPWPHRVVVVVVPWLSTCPLAAAAGPGSRYPPHISLTVRPEQVVAVLSWGSAGCYVWLSLSLMMMMMISLPSRCWQGTSQRSQCSAPLCSASLELAFYMLQQHARVTPAAAQGAITGELQSGPVNIHPARCSARQQPEIDTIWLFQMFTASHNVWCAGARGPPDCSLLTARTSLHRGPRSSWAQGGGPRRAPVLCCTARGKQG